MRDRDDDRAAEVAALRARAEEQDALMRVAEMVARATTPQEVFTVVTTETARLLGGEVVLARFEGADLAAVASSGGPVAVGHRHAVTPDTLPDLVRRRAAVVRVDDYAHEVDGRLAASLGVAAAVGAPVEVAGGVWGMLAVVSTAGPVRPGIEHRLVPFAKLAAAAVAGSQARADLRALADEQAALRRIAELPTRGASAADVLAAVTVEGSRLAGVDFAALLRYEPDGSTEVVALNGAPAGVAIGMRAAGTGDGAVQRLWRTGRAARVDDLADVPGRWPGMAHDAGFAASVAVPVRLEGRLWGALVVVGGHGPLPRGLEDRLADYAELVGLTISATEARRQQRALADEQAALRRVAELVARGAAPQDVFVAVTAETSALLGDLAAELLRFDGDTCVAVATHHSLVPAGLRVPARAGTPTGDVRRTGRPVRADTFEGTPLADLARQVGITCGVAIPVTVGGRVRAALAASSANSPLPADTEDRLVPFAELAAVAIANAEANEKLTASRARVVATADETRRRLQRDVHDGAQQRLVHAVIALKMARSTAEPGCAAVPLVEEALVNLERASRELRDIVHGILPRSLTHGGLGVGLESLVDDLPLPVAMRVDVPRLAETTETTAYFVVAEALTNAVKHAQATRLGLDVGLRDDTLVIVVDDDGIGGADPVRGSGLAGLFDRVDAVGGELTIRSGLGEGTTVRAELPVLGDPPSGRSR